MNKKHESTVLYLSYRIYDKDGLSDSCNLKNIKCLSRNKPKVILYQQKKNLYVIFRGTSRYDILHNIIKNVKIRLKKFNGETKIHCGFLSLFKKIEKDLFKTIDEYKFSNIIFGGSSLGGAISVLSAAYYKRFNKSAKVYNITCGLPPIGNNEFIKFYKSNIDGYKHFVIKNDPITMLNYDSLTFTKITKYLGYKEMPRYKVLYPKNFKIIHHSLIEYLWIYIQNTSHKKLYNIDDLMKYLKSQYKKLNLL